MSPEGADSVRPACVIAVGNEKGGSGKSTVAMHVAVALLKRGKSVATVDLDSRQRSLSHYVENRQAWAKRLGRALEMPGHICFDDQIDYPSAAGHVSAAEVLADTVDTLMPTYDFVVIDTPGYDGGLMRQAHAMADILVTPLNDSLVDLDVLGTLDADTLAVTGLGPYAATVDEARSERLNAGRPPTDWIVLRNRLSMTASRNKRQVDAGLQGLSDKLGFRYVEGLAERVVFREFFLRGLTALDDIDEATLGTRPTMSHVTARQEVERLLDSMRLDALIESGRPQSLNRDAA
jgi:chromosome partitioning protein